MLRALACADFWEYEPYEVSQGFQEQIPSPREFDLTVCCL